MSKSFVKFFLDKAGIPTEYVDNELVSKIEDNEFSIFVKKDTLSEKTNYIAIDYFNQELDKPIGLFATKAKIFSLVVMDGNNHTVWLAKTRKIREFIKKQKDKSVTSNGIQLYLFKYDFLLSEFTRIDNLHKEDIVKTVKRVVK